MPDRQVRYFWVRVPGKAAPTIGKVSYDANGRADDMEFFGNMMTSDAVHSYGGDVPDGTLLGFAWEGEMTVQASDILGEIEVPETAISKGDER